MYNTSDLVLCVNNQGVKFGTIRETDIAAWANEVKEFVDIEGRVYIVSANHINKPLAQGVDNIYVLKDLMTAVWNEKWSRELGGFSTTELNVLMDVYNLGDVDQSLLLNVEEHF